MTIFFVSGFSDLVQVVAGLLLVLGISLLFCGRKYYRKEWQQLNQVIQENFAYATNPFGLDLPIDTPVGSQNDFVISQLSGMKSPDLNVF